MQPSYDELARAIDALVDAERATCLWYLRADYHPRTNAERARVLDDIQRHGGLSAYKRAAQLKQWLSRLSNATSASS